MKKIKKNLKKMKISDAYKNAVGFLGENGIENCAFEVDCLFEKFYSVDRAKRINHPDYDVDYSLVEEALLKRAKSVPLQYILGSWEFFGFEYEVGEGVLIPRPETELLVEKATELLKGKRSPVIYDLCSGTGCIGLTLARLVPDSEVYLFEKSDKAFEYLLKNAVGVGNAFPVKADIFTAVCEEYKKPDLIISNPPYIRTDEIPFLQSEVLNEPSMALDGGEDGLDFYRLIADKWLPLLNGGGTVAIECAEEQSEIIIGLFSPFCKNTYAVKDYSGIDRIVIGEKQ
jgi:release factor glutamine methyltransferase